MKPAAIYTGDAMTILKTLPEKSIDCCITSPPYYGLRDYGTARWENGNDPSCDHEIPDNEKDPKNPQAGSHISRFNKKRCYRCGAKRIDDQIGMEETPDEYVKKIVAIFKEIRRIMKDNGTTWLNLGDSYAGSGGAGNNPEYMKKHIVFGKTGNPGRYSRPIPVPKGLKPKDLIGIPWKVAFALRDDGWYLRSDIIWSKNNCMPESCTDRPTRSHEYIFLLTKSRKYHYDHKAIMEPYAPSSDVRYRQALRMKRSYVTKAPYENNTLYGGKYKCGQGSVQLRGDDAGGLVVGGRNKGRNKRSVWNVNTKPFHGAHFAVFPEELITPCVLAGCPKDGTILDPFMGSGTTGVVALKHIRRFIGIELNPEYVKIAEKRLQPYMEQKRLQDGFPIKDEKMAAT